MNSESPHIVLAASGGVDSSVALALLAESGHRVTVAHLLLYAAEPEGIESLPPLCRRFGAPLEIVDLRARFEQCVVQPFTRAYAEGRTPNPCIVCNPTIKLGALMDWTMERGADAVATGHYARVERNPETGQYELRRGADLCKDQSYYLSRLSQFQLSHFVTPLGKMTKDAVRELARDKRVAAVDRAESQEVCFIPDDDYRAFLRERLGTRTPQPGPIVDVRDGAVLGRHDGIHRYTIGQRRGLGVSAPEPLYVVALRPEERTVAVGPASALLANTLEVRDISITDNATLPGKCRVQLRYRAAAQPAEVVHKADRAIVRFHRPQRAIAPGQTAAFYDEADSRVLGAGTIEAPREEPQ